jgi:hypothetical protein
MRICFVSIALLACGNDTRSDVVDASHAIEPDAPSLCPGELASCNGLCVNTRTDDDHCGACNEACAPAARCSASICACPAPFVSTNAPVLATTMLAAQTGFISGAVGLTGSDSMNHAVIVTAAATAPLNTPLAVNANNQVFVAISYDLVTATQSRSAFLATSGTVSLSRRCVTGIGGTLSNLMLVEIDPTTLAPIPNGCTTTLGQLHFNIAATCP